MMTPKLNGIQDNCHHCSDYHCHETLFEFIQQLSYIACSQTTAKHTKSAEHEASQGEWHETEAT